MTFISTCVCRHLQRLSKLLLSSYIYRYIYTMWSFVCPIFRLWVCRHLHCLSLVLHRKEKGTFDRSIDGNFRSFVFIYIFLLPLSCLSFYLAFVLFLSFVLSCLCPCLVFVLSWFVFGRVLTFPVQCCLVLCCLVILSLGYLVLVLSCLLVSCVALCCLVFV